MINITLLSKEKIQTGKEYYITMLHIAGYKNRIVTYTGDTYIDRDAIEKLYKNSKTSDTVKCILDSVLKDMIFVLCEKSEPQGKITHKVTKEPIKKMIQDYLSEKTSTQMELKHALLYVEDAFNDNFDYDFDIEVVDDDFVSNLSVGSMHRALLKVISDADPREVVDYDSFFNDVFRSFLEENNYTAYNIQEYNTQIDDLKTCFLDLLFEKNPEFKLIIDLFNIESLLGTYVLGSHEICESVKNFHDSIIKLSDSVTLEDRKGIKNQLDAAINGEDYKVSSAIVEEKLSQFDEICNVFCSSFHDPLSQTIEFSGVMSDLKQWFEENYLTPLDDSKTQDIGPQKSLQEQLDEALENEDYILATELRDKINKEKVKKA